MKKQKKTWKNFEITKVKLNPEQAVLTCCDFTSRAAQTSTQCFFGECGAGSIANALSS